jgi:hypothetical protein
LVSISNQHPVSIPNSFHFCWPKWSLICPSSFWFMRLGKMSLRLLGFCSCCHECPWGIVLCRLQKVWSQTQPPLGNFRPFIPCFGLFRMWPNTSIARMNKYGASRHPCLTDLASWKSLPVSPLTLTTDDAKRYKEHVHWIHLGLKPSLDKAGNKNPHSIL